jgi:cystathionine gamma-synthase
MSQLHKVKAEPGSVEDVKIINLFLDKSKETSKIIAKVSPSTSAVIFHKDLFPIAKQYWQHSGDGISSRRAEFCHSLFSDGKLVDSTSLQPMLNQKRGPKRYQKRICRSKFPERKQSYLRSRKLSAAS